MAAEEKKKEVPAAQPVKVEVAAQVPAPASAKAAKYIVVQQFHDIKDFNKIHKVGDNVSSMDEQRLKELVEGGLVDKQ